MGKSVLTGPRATSQNVRQKKFNCELVSAVFFFEVTTTDHTAPLIGKQDCELDRRLDRLVSDHVTYPRAFLGGSDSQFAGKNDARRIY